MKGLETGPVVLMLNFCGSDNTSICNVLFIFELMEVSNVYEILFEYKKCSDKSKKENINIREEFHSRIKKYIIFCSLCYFREKEIERDSR